MKTSPDTCMFSFVSLKDDNGIKEEIKQFEETIGNKVPAILRYISWDDDFPAQSCNVIVENNSIPVITWEVYWESLKGGPDGDPEAEETSVDILLRGERDSYIEKFAQDVKKFGHEVFLRPLHEFNANWYCWCGPQNGGPEKIKKAWIYIVDKFREAGADNVRWIWCAHEPSMNVALDDWNDIKNYWPGDDYVDWMGIDGFNFYPENPERKGRVPYLSFDDCFSDFYTKMTELSNKPVFIMTGTGEFSYNQTTKADWVEDAFIKMKESYPAIKICCWFDYKYNEKTDWRVNSSQESLKIFKKYLDSSYYR